MAENVARDGPNTEGRESNSEKLGFRMTRMEPNLENLESNTEWRSENENELFDPSLEQTEVEWHPNQSNSITTQEDISTVTKSSTTETHRHRKKRRPKYRNQAEKSGSVSQKSSSVGEADEKRDGEKAQNSVGDGGEGLADGGIEEVLTVTVPSWKERPMMALAEKAQEILPGMRKSVKSRRKLEDKASLSHKRRIQHLIEQSRLKSRFGQLLGAAAIASECTETSEYYPEHPEHPSLDIKVSSVYVSEAWSPRKGSDTSYQDTQDSTTLKGKHSLLGKQEHQQQQQSKSSKAPQNVSGAPKKDGTTNSKSIKENVVPSEYVKPELLGEDLLLCSGIKPSRPLLRLYGDQSGETNIIGSNQLPGFVPLQTKKMATISEKYIDKLSEKVPSDVRITVPELRYSKLGGVERSQSMHF